MREYGDGWKKKYSDQIETKELKMEEQIRMLETKIKHRVKKIKEVEKMNTLLEDRSSTLEETLKEGRRSYKRTWNYDVRSTFIVDGFVPF